MKAANSTQRGDDPPGDAPGNSGVELARACAAVIGEDAVLSSHEERLAYDVDGFTLEKHLPDVVVLPRTTEDVRALLALAHARDIPVTPRGAGTGLAGGAHPAQGGIVLSTARMNAILALEPVDRFAVVQPGVVNLHLSQAAARYGLHYAPDPSSQMASTLGGNASTNAGGPHCLKYGMTHQHVRGLTCVLADGTVVRAGGETLDPPGLDLVGALVGSEGTFAVVTELVVGLVPVPADVRTFLAVYDSIEAAAETVSAIIAQGIVPAALEMLDHLTITAVEPNVHLGLPLDAQAALLVEIDGPAAVLDRQAGLVRELCGRHGARSVREAADARERALLWKARKGAFGAMGRIANGFYVMDGVVPRTRLPAALRAIAAIAQRHELRIANVFHAGDGNLHPNVLYDVDDPASVKRALLASEEILAACVALGGSLSGEHGIGSEKRELMGLLFSADDLAQFAALRRAWNPSGRLNPNKILPLGKGCGEVDARALLALGRRFAGAGAFDDAGDAPWI